MLQTIRGYRPIRYPFDYAPSLHEDPARTAFDFVVVGGGSAGAAVAARLSEVPEWNVLLLEAGGDPPEHTENPALWRHSIKTDCDWAFLTERHPSLFKGMDGERCLISRGRALGGSSSINGVKYLRGTRADFDGWEREHGCRGWGYDAVLPYFKKSEDFVDPDRFDADIHAHSGPLTVSPMLTFDPVHRVIADAERALNLTMVDDVNREEPVVGFGDPDSTAREGRRCSTLKAFLLPASDRPNLFVAKNTVVRLRALLRTLAYRYYTAGTQDR